MRTPTNKSSWPPASDVAWLWLLCSMLGTSFVDCVRFHILHVNSLYFYVLQVRYMYDRLWSRRPDEILTLLTCISQRLYRWLADEVVHMSILYGTGRCRFALHIWGLVGQMDPYIILVGSQCIEGPITYIMSLLLTTHGMRCGHLPFYSHHTSHSHKNKTLNKSIIQS